MKKMTRLLGFTLIELLVVITIIAVLASIALPVFSGVQERARATQDMSNLRQVGVATQTYLNDSDNVLFSSDASAGSWMAQLHPKYLPAWKVLESPFDKRAPSEDDTKAPISYGLNGNTPPGSTATSMAGTLMDKITNPSAFILFAPAQNAKTITDFDGNAATAAPGVTVFRETSAPGGAAGGGTHSKRSRINVCFADMHVENMLWNTFKAKADKSADPSSEHRWDL